MKKICIECGKKAKLEITENDQTIGYLCQNCFDKNLEKQGEIEDLGNKIGIVEASLGDIEYELRRRLKEIGSGYAAKLLNMHQPDIALFISGSRKFSLKKMKKIYEKLANET